MPEKLDPAPRLTQQAPFAVCGRLLRGPGEPVPGAVIVAEGKVVAVETPAEASRLPPRRLHAAFIAPGFVDVQVNGGFGFEVGGDPGALSALAARLPCTGVTSFLPTLISTAEADYASGFSAYRVASGAAAAASGRSTPPLRVAAARLAGLHLEGPFLAVGRAGAHRRACVEAADVELVRRLADPALVRLVTLAPERPGALPLIAWLKARGVTVALGHTDASFAAFTAGVDAGGSMATHLFNAMSPLDHREPGAVGAALTDDRVTAFVIADGVHTHPAMFRLAARAKSVERLGLVTDAMAGAGLPPGRSTLGGREVILDGLSARLVEDVAKAGAARDQVNGPGTLAGSVLTMDQAVRNVVSFGGLTPAAAVHMATEIPARAVGLAECGRLRVGGAADLVLLDEHLAVTATFVGGVLAYSHDLAEGGVPLTEPTAPTT